MNVIPTDKNDKPYVKYLPFIPSGSVNIPPSKSDVHRAVICAALSGGKCSIAPVAMSNDIAATVGAIETLGCKTKLKGNTLEIDGTNIFKTDNVTLDCGESGSTLRFFIPVAAVGGVSATFIGHGKLPSRPIGVFTEALPKVGVRCDTEGGLPLKISGKLQSGVFEIPGNISSQFITGLLLALPLAQGDSEIVLTSPVQSVGYINMTINTMRRFGVEVQTTERGWKIKGGQSYKPQNYTTDGDWSQAAFFMVAAAIGGKVTVNGVSRTSAQGDKKITDLLQNFGANVEFGKNRVTVTKNELRGIDIDASQIPDLVPALAVCAAFARGSTKIYNAERLRIKECDRLTATAEMINSLGGSARELKDGLEINGVPRLSGGFCNGFNDHRIVMSAGICASGLKDGGEITASHALSINKSYPDFYTDYNGIGGKANVLDIR